ncbi:MAG: geranylgeranylglyceryl/heptaprenylglyceryl phosphate synthase [Flavobacteriales bacterium]|nr:geranylgeranylglyceryl/heptaprenylglyceryl phosphate synthase [Flavobacteriales bacterium]MCW8912185.1 geranylgeranylglyceryl/heptaprenylglyceryl phosphate synthase [Flavobacteriales bacterium]MCW8938006.1 geranylgeranylglyceryl/heptaprenylglyceryl phosphate synthase [Flavobacteriales bacterium]MCW8940719.1 geranylgeranylglyceryl/heptaprenylglyceryl phosphate synthase [Flavobacteriales bacterium]MCW8967275.1 geranylgeranylglyceryl/heptaprenylglyceryl phosphate synthase [Flavobacteriales bact
MEINQLYSEISAKMASNKKMLAVLIDPDKQNYSELLKTVNLCNDSEVDFIFVGGSLLTNGDIEKTARFIKENTSIPLIIFPGSTNQITHYADGILMLSLISGRNAEFLIGNHVVAAPYIKKANLEALSTGYILVDGGAATTVSYISNTLPIPHNKPEIATVTALAGEYLGMKMIYLDAGSGAKQHVAQEMIQQVKATISIPLIVGGGITNAATAQQIYVSGADMIVIGNGTESNRNLITEISKEKFKIAT